MNENSLKALNPERIRSIFERNFRSLVIGSSGTGKSFFLTQKVLPVIQDRYDFIVVFTRPTNYEYYIRQTYDYKANRPLPKESWFSRYVYKQEPPPVTNFVYVSTEQNEFTSIINSMPNYQQANIKSIDDEGNPVYKYRGLFIFDDVLDEKFNKSQAIVDLFTHYRHYNIDTFFLVQTSTNLINTMMTNNIDIMIMTRMNLANMRDRCLNSFLKDIVKTTDMSDPQAKTLVKNIYKQVCEEEKHGVLLLDMDNTQIYYTTSKVQPREVKGYTPPKINKPKTYTDKMKDWWYGKDNYELEELD